MDGNARRSRLKAIASELIRLLEIHHEFRQARDRIGDRDYLMARTKLVDTLIDFARETVMAARDRT